MTTKAHRQKLLDTANEVKRLGEEYPASSAEHFELAAAFACIMRARRISGARELDETTEATFASEQPR